MGARHEMFLSSDAMRGRGSATPDEWITATYVASEFEQYGLKPGLADGTWVQRVELIQPVIEDAPGSARLKEPDFAALEQGKDFIILRSRGQSVSGPLLKIESSDIAGVHLSAGAILLLAGTLDGSREMQ